MENSRWKAWVELGAALAVFVGLIFVAIELRQNNDHARAESIRDLFQTSKASRVWLRNNENWAWTISSEFYSALVVEIEKNPVALEMPQLDGFEPN